MTTQSTFHSTITDVKNDNDYIAHMEGMQGTYSLYFIYRGGSKIEYYFFDGEILLFAGNDYKPAPGMNVDSLESMINLLGFLTCQVGDTYDSYFENYTPAQIAFTENYDCEMLKGLIMDFEDGTDKSVFTALYNA